RPMLCASRRQSTRAPLPDYTTGSPFHLFTIRRNGQWKTERRRPSIRTSREPDENTLRLHQHQLRQAVSRIATHASATLGPISFETNPASHPEIQSPGRETY